MAVVGIHKTLLQVAHPGALLGHQLLTLLHLCLLLHVQGSLQLCSPAPLLIHLALEALVLILSLLYTSHQSKHAQSPVDHVRHHVSQATRMHTCCCHSLLCHTVATHIIPRYYYWHEHLSVNCNESLVVMDEWRWSQWCSVWERLASAVSLSERLVTADMCLHSRGGDRPGAPAGQRQWPLEA